LARDALFAETLVMMPCPPPIGLAIGLSGEIPGGMRSARSIFHPSPDFSAQRPAAERRAPRTVCGRSSHEFERQKQRSDGLLRRCVPALAGRPPVAGSKIRFSLS